MKNFKLDEHPKIQSGFQTPDSYFDRLQGNVLSRMSVPEAIPINRRKTWLYAAAAVVVAALGTTYFNAISFETDTADTTTIENYLALQSDTEELLVDLLAAEDIEKLHGGYDFDDRTVEELLLHSNIEQYIIN